MVGWEGGGVCFVVANWVPGTWRTAGALLTEHAMADNVSEQFIIFGPVMHCKHNRHTFICIHFTGRICSYEIYRNENFTKGHKQKF